MVINQALNFVKGGVKIFHILGLESNGESIFVDFIMTQITRETKKKIIEKKFL